MRHTEPPSVFGGWWFVVADVGHIDKMSNGPHIEGMVEFLTTEAGGRKGPAFSGYRPQFYYAGRDWDANQEYPDVKQVNPGDTVRTIFSFLSPSEHWGMVEVGMPFLIREGARTVAYGKVTKILEALERDAMRDSHAPA